MLFAVSSYRGLKLKGENKYCEQRKIKKDTC